MISPNNPELSFLIESLHLSPDAFFESIYKQKGTWKIKSLMDAILSKTTDYVGIQDMRHFSPEIVDSWGDYVKDRELKTINNGKKDDEKLPSVFEFIRKIGNEYLLLQNGEPFFKIEKLNSWQHVSFHCGEDIFVAAMLADNSIKNGYEPRSFQWSYIIKSDFALLNNLIIQNEIVENHYHLGGSSPMVDLSWIYLMNHPYGQEKGYDAFLKERESFYSSARSLNESYQSELQSLMKVAAYIRLWLFQRFILGLSASKIEEKENTDEANESGAKRDEWNAIENSIEEFSSEEDNDVRETKRNVFENIHQILHEHGVLQEDFMKSTIETYLYESPYSVFDTKVDYAIRDFRIFSDESNSYIAGERYFNYCCLKHIFTHPSDGYTLVLYYMYLLIKYHFDLYFIQANKKTGFQNFREYTERKSKFIDRTEYKNMAVNMAIQGNIRENYLNQLEVRIVPFDSEKTMSGYINKTDKKAFFRSSRITRYERITPREPNGDRLRYSDGTDKYFYVLHFTKSKTPEWYAKDKNVLVCRESKKREEYRRKAELFMRMRDNNEEICSRVFGIDAASNEVNFRPENFGTVFRYLSSSRISQDVPWKRKIPDLRKTYHVGEDFYEVVDGLRAIDEAVLYLELSQGDRIGHGVALGIDVDKWYERHPVIALPLQNKIDNVAWMLFKIREWGLDVSTAYYEKLLTEFERLYLQLYKDNSPGLFAYMTAWELRGDDPQCYFNPCVPDENWMNPVTQWERYSIRDRRLYKSLKQLPKVYELYHKYHFDNDLKRMALKKVTHEFNQDEFAQERMNLVKQLQIRMRDFIAGKGIAVESCPSSNFLISNLDEFKEIPTFNLFPVRESHADFERLNVCVNTDDQGVFYTNLVKEYTLLVGTLRQQKENNVRELSDDKILNWVKHLIDYSKQLCFRTGDVEFYGIRSDNDLFEDYREKPLDDRYVLPCIS